MSSDRPEPPPVDPERAASALLEAWNRAAHAASNSWTGRGTGYNPDYLPPIIRGYLTVCTLAGMDVTPIYDVWTRRYREYVALGGKAAFRSIGRHE